MPVNKIVVIDTSSIMADPDVYLSYPGDKVVIPLTVITELDENKKRDDAPGRNAREFLRQIELIRQKNKGIIGDNEISLDNGSILQIPLNGIHHSRLESLGLSTEKGDHRILSVALGYTAVAENKVMVVSNDTSMRIKAAALGLYAEEHRAVEKSNVHRTGYHMLDLAIYSSTETLDVERIDVLNSLRLANDPNAEELEVRENEFVIQEGSALVYRRKGAKLTRANSTFQPWGIKPRGLEQKLALELLADPNISLIALRGSTGTGKTSLALAAGLEAVIERQTHERLVILRPMSVVGGEELGFLPGDIKEKTEPHFQALIDVYQSFSRDKKDKLSYSEAKNILDGLMKDGKVAMDPISFLRGRTLHDTFVIVDEAQNLGKTEIKTAISRIGENSRIVICGDHGQIDHPFLSKHTTGINVVMNAFSGRPEFGQISFTKGQRSRLADLADELL